MRVKCGEFRSAVLRISLIASTLISSIGFAADAPGAGAGIAARPNVVNGKEINDAQKKCVAKGLEWLARKQANNGSYGAQIGNQAGITALAALAFMQDGNLPGRGKYGLQVERAMKFVLASCQESGLVASENSYNPMYGHGFATLFLGEIYGMTGDDAVKDKLTKAVRLIEKTQNPEGGWRYQPVPNDADISVTICQVMALRAARDAGIKVEKKVIDNAVKYVRACQNPDGGFSYMARMGGGMGSGFARTAAGVSTLYYAGVFEGNDLERGLKYLDGVIGNFAKTGVVDGDGHFCYGHYYCVQAMFLAGGTHWDTYYPAIRDTLIKRQSPEGNWNIDMGDDYATSMCLIIIQMPNRYLPVYSGKGPGS